MSMKVNEAVLEINKNAREHGWWEEPRQFSEIIALIHSELSEALEEYRNHRDMVWYDEERHHKPEGIATELIDAVIRIFDWIGQENGNMEEDMTIDELIAYGESQESDLSKFTSLPLPTIVTETHLVVSRAYDSDNMRHGISMLLIACAKIMIWVKYQGIDPEALMIEKHEYNKTRPYRHGNKAC